MKLEIPVLVTQQAGPDPFYLARPLFHPEPEIGGKLLDRVLSRLTADLRKILNAVSQESRLETFANLSYCPNLYDKSFRFTFHYKKRTVKGEFLVVVLPDREPRVAFFPQLNLWFQLPRGADLRDRSAEVLDGYFGRGQGTASGDEFTSSHWITEVELHYRVPDKPSNDLGKQQMMILGGRPVQAGWLELENVGRNLDDLYPHELGRCLCRERQADKLQRTLKASKAPQLVVGPRKVGKTALIHEMVRRYRKKKGRVQRRFWLLSPQRLISGMSYVGQWESRLMAILKYASEKNLVLIFSDLLGLFSAGVTRDSNLCVADVLKPFLQRKQVQILGECTEQGLAVLRERDRGFADLFSITRLEETTAAETLEIALEEVRESERTHACQFELDAILSAVDIQKRYVRDSSFPGKGASFLRKVAARNRAQVIDAQSVLEYFRHTSGMSLRMLDDQVKLERAKVLESLRKQVLGQETAVEAAADAVMMAKTRLADPTRPIAGLLFVGPTGVGKTECAKALARYLFGDEDRLLRFDMNEYVSPYSATRLVGTFHQPDGLLTAAVRRRPFCVLLLDEIEKAHHEVFNLLLQVLGDGRLTDARGRTVDFTQTIVILTSNLGVAEASKPIGLRSKEAEEGLTYYRAVEAFFPPEFFNRLDKVVPFSRLSRDDTSQLARGLLNKVLAREGLVRRQCILDVSPEAMEAIVDLGYHPQLGARALKRAIEKKISAPVSARLSEMKPHSPTVIGITAREDLQVSVQELLAASPRGVAPSSVDERFLDRVEQWLHSKESALHINDDLIGEELSEEQIWYYSCQDGMRRVRAIASKLKSYLSQPGQPTRRPDLSHRLLHTRNWRSVMDQKSLGVALRELFETVPTRTENRLFQGKVCELLAECAGLERGSKKEALLSFHHNPAAEPYAKMLRELYRESLEHLELGTEKRKTKDLPMQGNLAAEIASSESGLHLFSTDSGLLLVEVGRQESPPVVRVYDEHLGTVDLRTGWMTPSYPTPLELAYMTLLSLVPEELCRLGGTE
ncbi:MAG: ATP-dependent Clp protease ATP-binding subunit [Candidatus Eremiobacteraeota bacterium]|nr:ATP-dependent Clp protease ATP-binding subunit [Candidatus Eremiobacteraeota bacterium]